MKSTVLFVITHGSGVQPEEKKFFHERYGVFSGGTPEPLSIS
jgi:hypothetical protein